MGASFLARNNDGCSSQFFSICVSHLNAAASLDGTSPFFCAYTATHANSSLVTCRMNVKKLKQTVDTDVDSADSLLSADCSTKESERSRAQKVTSES
jgi:hypothetical protein